MNDEAEAWLANKMTNDEWRMANGAGGVLVVVRGRTVRAKAVSSLRFATAVQDAAGC